jgi:hypothetical protein
MSRIEARPMPLGFGVQLFGHSGPFLGGNLKNIAPFKIRRRPVCVVPGGVKTRRHGR